MERISLRCSSCGSNNFVVKETSDGANKTIELICENCGCCTSIGFFDCNYNDFFPINNEDTMLYITDVREPITCNKAIELSQRD